MAETYTSGWESVREGEQTSFDVPDTYTLVSNELEVRWRGDSEQRTNTGLHRNNTRTSFRGEGNSVTRTLDWQSVSDGQTLEYKTFDYSAEGPKDGNEYEARWDVDGGGSGSNQFSDVIRDPDRTEDVPDKASSLTITIELKNGYGGTDVYVETNTWYSAQHTVETQDPKVTLNNGNSASEGGTLSDGNVTPWKSISGLSDGTNVFDHDIDGSNDADFQFRYDYLAAPVPVGYAESGDGSGGTQLLPLADTDSPALVNTEGRVGQSNGTVAAADLVATDHPNATNVRVGLPDGTVLAWREDLYDGGGS